MKNLTIFDFQNLMLQITNFATLFAPASLVGTLSVVQGKRMPSLLEELWLMDRPTLYMDTIIAARVQLSLSRSLQHLFYEPN